VAHWVRRRRGWQSKALKLAAVSAYACHYCQRTDGARTKDHKLPKLFGGSGKAENMAVCCKMCNLIKGPRLYAWFVPVFREFLDVYGDEYCAANPDDGETIRVMARKYDAWLHRLQHGEVEVTKFEGV
jgi:hypothetical protein